MDQINELGFNETTGGMYCYPTNEDALLANNNEHALLEKTRCELLNGNDFWWCPRCAVGVPSLALACGECNDTISFVPLELEEFESFVRKQREKNVRNNASELWKQQATKEKQREEESGDESNSSESESEDEDEHVNNVCLVTPNEESLVTPYLFYIMKHVRKSHLESLDNGARSAAFESGKPGLECMYCNGGRKFFYRDASVLSDNLQHIPNHLLKCDHCPDEVKRTIVQKKKEHQILTKRKGAYTGANRKLFFQTIYKRLHSKKWRSFRSAKRGIDVTKSILSERNGRKEKRMKAGK